MNPANAQNNGKWHAWKAVGIDVEDPKARDAAAQEVVAWLREEVKALRFEWIPPPESTEYGLRCRLEFKYTLSKTQVQGVLATVWQVSPDGKSAKLITNLLKTF